MDLRWHVKSLSARAAVWLIKSTGWYNSYFNHWRMFFDYAERRGLHIFPVHHYTPIPDTQHLAESLWSEKRKLPALDLRETKAVAYLKKLLPKYRSECAALRKDKSSDRHEYTLDNEAFGRGDADALYSLIRSSKPHKIIEIGSGLTICRHWSPNNCWQPGLGKNDLERNSTNFNTCPRKLSCLPRRSCAEKHGPLRIPVLRHLQKVQRRQEIRLRRIQDMHRRMQLCLHGLLSQGRRVEIAVSHA